MRRWVAAMSAHDLEAAVACFDPDYRDEAPAHGTAFRGIDVARRNFAALFRDIPDLVTELLDLVTGGGRTWVEWRMRGTRPDGSRFEFVGVNIFTVRGGRIAEGRIYTELVRDVGGIEGQVDPMTRGPAGRGHP